MDGSPPGSPVLGILQARTLEWVAISFSNAWKWKVKVKSLSRVWLFATPWTSAYQAPLSMGLSRQEYWSGVLLPSLFQCLGSLKKEKKCLLSGIMRITEFLLSKGSILPLMFTSCYIYIWNATGLWNLKPRLGNVVTGRTPQEWDLQKHPGTGGLRRELTLRRAGDSAELWRGPGLKTGTESGLFPKGWLCLSLGSHPS